MSRNAHSGGYFSSRRQNYSSSSNPYNDSDLYYEQRYEQEDRYGQSTSQRRRDRRPSSDYNQYVVHDPTSSQRDMQRDRSSRTPSPVSQPPSVSQRARSPSPPAPPPPRSPSPTYLLTSLIPSESLSPSTTTRKLLILDLNGTLLIRSPHTGGRAAYRWVNGQPPPPRMRSAHPRPYMASFQSYLFHPETKEWLDVMVWSSAQPHSVDDMVGKCFGERRRELKAVWARDTLGLSSNQYHTKTQTTKDLTKPWDYFASLANKEASRSPSSSRSASPEPSSETMPVSRGSPAAQVHSALTTLLLDDSPAKAHLQPYNHICIKEYDAPLRRADFDIFEAERARQRELEEEAEEASTETSGALSPDLDNGDDRAKKRKRKKKKKKAVALAEAVEGKQYDATLLAIVGILDEIKRQGNVAGWIRSGGLWGPRRDEVQAQLIVQRQTKSAPALTATASSSSVDNFDVHLDKRQKLRGVSTSGSEEGSEDAQKVNAGNDAVSSVQPASEFPMEPTGGSAEGVPGLATTKMWFEDPETVAYWADNGRTVLEQLGIPVKHGLES
ncbi:hypothetical protein NEOLEDRAFT_1140602 [Neolentinus lepideus HHB14362 ss-1]|uniref:Mitochondrial import inner membrane translocase subunit TIM50 n=1 Tax=Neolentinus lepideus HHB14362 ss-1 TaxID=1314782 RepID=A0A165P4A1_9AGAM|nr:hypothetical protein NEOLEDRAFT_1140602 [Neolentinus lepideus HHB14362 ss-1]